MQDADAITANTAVALMMLQKLQLQITRAVHAILSSLGAVLMAFRLLKAHTNKVNLLPDFSPFKWQTLLIARLTLEGIGKETIFLNVVFIEATVLFYA